MNENNDPDETLTVYGTSSISNRNIQAEENNTQAEEAELKYGASHVIYLFVPVSMCMALVVITMNLITFYNQSNGRHLLYTPFVQETDSVMEKGLMSLGNALVMLGVVITMTILLIVFYKYKWYKLIHGWLIMSSFLLLFLFTTIYVQEIMKSYKMFISSPVVLFALANYGIMGMMCIHWKGPLKLQQFYLITMSALMALVFIKYLPDWTVWFVLFVISVWDLVAVLTPKGPLRYLVETAQERNEPIFPALIYSSGILYPYVLITAAEIGSVNNEETSNNVPESMSQSSNADRQNFVVKRIPQKPVREVQPSNINRETNSTNTRVINRAPIVHQRDEQQQEEHGVKLGLGDFIFYSVLLGKASSYYDWNTTVACYVAILIGLCFTLVLLAVFKRALPALPISIFAGLVFYFCTRWIMTPFVTTFTKFCYLF